MQHLYIKPFVVSATKIIKLTTGIDAFKKNIYAQKGKKSLGGIGIVLGIRGDIGGKVIYEFSRGMTMRLASKMIKRSVIPFENREQFLALLKSAIKELGNLISGRALTYLLKNGYNCRITPPKIYTGQGIRLIPAHCITYVIELQTKYGDFVINLALEKQSAENKKYLLPDI